MITLNLHSLAYWSAVVAVATLTSFIVWTELFSLITKTEIHVSTPGWRGTVPCVLLVGFCFAASLSTILTVLTTWF